MTYFYLFLEFFKTGLFAVGGGLATIPFLMEIAERYPWFTPDELTNIIAVSESTPGPIGVNMATYSGFKAAGVPGAILATLSLVLPSIIVITIIAGFLNKFKENKIVNDTFYGIRAAVVGLLLVSLLNVALPLLFNFAGESFLTFINLKVVILFGLLLFGILKFKKHPIIYIAIGAVAGIIFKF